MNPDYFCNDLLEQNNCMVGWVSEPGTIALGGLGLAALMLVRRKKA